MTRLITRLKTALDLVRAARTVAEVGPLDIHSDGNRYTLTLVFDKGAEQFAWAVIKFVRARRVSS